MDGQRAITRRAGLVAAGTLLSRILGAARDAVIAAFFTVTATDAFYVAFTIPNVLRSLLAEGAVAGAYIPVMADLKQSGGMDAVRRFHSALAARALLVLALVSATGVVVAPYLATLYAAGYQGDARFGLTVTLTRIVFPYIFFMGAAALCVAALQALGRFTASSLAPALLNVALIAAPFALVPAVVPLGLPPITALAIGAIVGGLLQLGALLPAMSRAGVPFRPRWIPHPDLGRVVRLMLPLVAGLGVYQVDILISRLLASYLPEGSQSYLYYGQRLVELPQGVFALAVGAASLPSLAALAARNDQVKLRLTFTYALRLALFVAVPASIALVVLAEPTVVVLFGRGRFDHAMAVETARSLRFMAAGIWAVSAVRVITPAFYAFQDTRTPVIVAAIDLIVFLSAALLLMGPMQHAGLALAMTAASSVQLVLLLAFLRRRTGPMGLRTVGISVGRFLCASAPMALVAWWTARLGQWEEGGNQPRNILVFAGAIVAGGAVYALMAWLLRAPEIGELAQAIARRKSSRAR